MYMTNENIIYSKIGKIYFGRDSFNCYIAYYCLQLVDSVGLKGNKHANIPLREVLENEISA